MMIDFKETVSNSKLSKLINQSENPTIIALCQKNSFGRIWLSKLLREIKEEYQQKLQIETFFIDNQPNVTIYLVNKKEVKIQLLGSVSKKVFKEKLNSIIS